MGLFVLFAAVALTAPAAEPAKPEPKADPRYLFRTDFANASLPWYKPKTGEFPPHHSDRRISGELVSADFIHRTGQFRTRTGELVDFSMPPYGSIGYLNAEADLRDVPLGTFCLFFLNQDDKGNFTRLATSRDEFSIDAGHGFSYRLDELKLAEGKLLTTKQALAKKQADLGKKEWLVTPVTRVWKGDKQVKLNDLALGDDLLFNTAGKTATDPGHCTDIWVGADTHKLATETQRKKFAAFQKFRGLPGWIDNVDGQKLTITLFTGEEAKTFKDLWLGEFAVGKELRVCVANDELRTWNPPVDNERGNILEVKTIGVGAYGTSGVRLTFTVAHLLEGFRKGRIVRIFGPGWKLKDSPYGESLMGYGYGAHKDLELVENVAKEYPTQFPFRTDYGNDQLPWYQLQAGVTPPRFSEHLVMGELVKVDAGERGGQFRTDHSGELVDFTLIPQVLVSYLGADAELSDLPLGGRCRFNMYQDEKGGFTRASLVSDEFSYLARNSVTLRIEALKLDEGKLHVARQIPEVKNYNGDMERPNDIGRAELRVNAETRVWKGAQQLKLSDLAVGDSLVVDLTSEQPGSPSRCTDIWVGDETQKLATEGQHKKHSTGKK
jgi:hypothetical protein